MGNNTVKTAKILRTMLLLLPLMIVASLFLYKGVKADAAVTGTVTASSLFVREGPGSQYDIKKSDGEQIRLAQGDYVVVSWEENGWYYIDSSFKGKMINGYVSKDFVKVSGAIPTGRPAATPTPITQTGTVGIPEGTTLAVMSKGFPYTGWVVATTLNVRDGAGTNFNIIDTLKSGDKVSVTGVKKSNVGAYWYTINYIKNGVSCDGVASSTYIAVEVKGASAPTATPGVNGTTLKTDGFPANGKVVADALNVRNIPDVRGQRVTILVANEKVSVVGIEKAENGTWWYKISFKKNTVDYVGYVLSDYVQVEGAASATKTPTPIPTRDPYENVIRYYEIPTNDRGALYYSAVVSVNALNMRETASVSGKPITKLDQNTRVIVLEKVNGNPGMWYKIAVKQAGKVMTGYASSEYIRLDYEGGVYGLINKTGTLLRTQPNASAEYSVNSAGMAIAFSLGDKVLLVGESDVGGEKWFMVQMSDGTLGHLICNELELTGGNVVTAAPTATPTPTNTPTPTPKYSTTPTPTKRPTSTPRPSGYPTPQTMDINANIPTGYAEGYCTGYGFVRTGSSVTLGTRPGRSYAVTGSNGRDVVIDPSMSLALFNKYESEDGLYRQVRVVDNGNVYYGFIEDSLIIPFTEDEYKTKITPTPIPNLSGLEESEIAFILEDYGFPSSYIGALLELLEDHPNWVFEPDITGLNWEDVIENESKTGVNLIPGSYASGMLSTEEGAYDWKNDKYVVFDGPNWVTASKAANEYYIDPRNWFDPISIFMFETLSYKKQYQTVDQVEELLTGTPFHNRTFSYTDEYGYTKSISYAQAFIDAADYSGVSPYHLVTRVRQEVVTGSSSVSDSVSGTVSGYTGYYNFYNIGAYHSTTPGGAVINGLKYAKNGLANSDDYNDKCLIPWDNQYKAIVGGAYIIGQSYINRGQDTIYLQKFNVSQISTFGHQYMANIEAPKSEAAKMAKAYPSSDTTVVFKIPVYENMPEENAEKPTSSGNPNNALSSLTVLDMYGRQVALSPAFDPVANTDYYITTTAENNILQIVAKAASSKAEIGGNGTVVVSSNSDVFEVTVTAENGDVRVYRIHASKQ